MPRKPSQKTQKLLSESKVQRVLESMKVDYAEFRRMYAQEPSRRGRGMREPDTREIKAVEEFERTGDFASLRKALGKSAQMATAAVARVIAFKAGQKGSGRSRRD